MGAFLTKKLAIFFPLKTISCNISRISITKKNMFYGAWFGFRTKPNLMGYCLFTNHLIDAFSRLIYSLLLPCVPWHEWFPHWKQPIKFNWSHDGTCSVFLLCTCVQNRLHHTIYWTLPCTLKGKPEKRTRRKNEEMAHEERVVNFFPGPSALPTEVSAAFWNYHFPCASAFWDVTAPKYGCTPPNMAYVSANMATLVFSSALFGVKRKFEFMYISFFSRNSGEFFMGFSCVLL